MLRLFTLRGFCEMGNAGLFKTAQPIFSLKAIDNSYIKGCILTGLKEKYTGNLTSGVAIFTSSLYQKCIPKLTASRKYWRIRL